MSDIATSRYLLKTVNKNVIINPYRFASSASTLLNGLSHWWDLLGNANDSVGGVTLSTSETFNGTAPSGETNCLNFDGTGGAVNTDNSVTGASRSEITIGLWFKLTNTAGRAVWYFGAENYLQIVSGTGRYRVNSAATVVGDNTISTNTWYCSIFSGGTGTSWNAYINDVFDENDSSSFDFTTADGDFALGSDSGANWRGLMCGCAIWDRILTPEERTEFYNGGINLKYNDLL